MSKETQMDESSGRRKFCIVPGGKFRGFEKRMLCDSGCPYTLPMHFLAEDRTEKACYDFTGFIQLAEYIKREAGNQAAGNTAAGEKPREKQRAVFGALDILSGILECLKGMENYLLFPERLQLHPDVIFINADSGRAAVAFYPCGNSETSLQSMVAALIEDMNIMYRDDEAGRYLIKLKDFIRMKNPGLEGIISSLGTLQREISYIYWKPVEFRNAEEPAPLYESALPDKLHRRTAATAIAIQGVFGAGLTAVFLSGALDIVSFAGLAAIAAGADLWIMRKLRRTA